LSHGYPSDARSSLLQERQIIASRSRRISRIQELFRGRTTAIERAGGSIYVRVHI
jgi:hypothetical protein